MVSATQPMLRAAFLQAHSDTFAVVCQNFANFVRVLTTGLDVHVLPGERGALENLILSNSHSALHFKFFDPVNIEHPYSNAAKAKMRGLVVRNITLRIKTAALLTVSGSVEARIRRGHPA
jgi:hypothetical protein